MPRTLPWLTGVVKAERKSNSPTPEIKRTSSPRGKDETPSRKQPAKSRRDFFRSSPSPPSSPIHSCPSEEFLKEGLDKDDIYIMVEDEFYAVAQTFTQHLHYAEYIRRGREAKLQNAAKIEDIARPTDGVTPMSEALKKKYAAEDLRARQKDGADRLDENGTPDGDEKDPLGEDIEEENSWTGTHLQDLMLSPRRVRSLVGLQGIRSSTRAAAGFAQARGSGRKAMNGGGGQVEKVEKEPSLPDETTEDDDDDDLDAMVPRPVPAASRWSTTAPKLRPAIPATKLLAAKPIAQPASKAIRSTDDTKNKSHELKSENKIAANTQAKRRTKFDDFDGFTPTPTPTTDVTRADNSRSNTAQITQTKRRRAFDDFDELPELRKPSEQPQRRQFGSNNAKQMKPKDKDTGTKKSRLNEVPTFLI
ncbi:hypothetical protein ASPCAL12130 [Aspergillus calidoustus]|uniref:Uncharacterized protein n=1 Tax=Aspergillus calidoustus TaxID=454130 RepID=A0A0U5CFA9_ASPCI|nr:hypothetical protein ASPCAL12130 [Aspergillus calidoustus]